jgi:hypothetical protein
VKWSETRSESKPNSCELVLAGGQLMVLLHHVHAKKRLQKTSAL